jgi:hypothetical protein
MILLGGALPLPFPNIYNNEVGWDGKPVDLEDIRSRRSQTPLPKNLPSLPPLPNHPPATMRNARMSSDPKHRNSMTLRNPRLSTILEPIKEKTKEIEPPSPTTDSLTADQIDMRNRRRTAIVQEILSTEKSYLTNLKRIVEVSSCLVGRP